MAATVKEIEIKAPPAKVFSYVANLPKHGEWGSHKVQVTPTSSGPIAVGATFEGVGHQMGAHRDRLTITEYTPSQRLAFESSGDAGTVRHVFEVTPSNGGARLSKSMEVIKPSFMTRLMAPLIAMTGPKMLAKDLERIKERVESSRP